MNESLPISTRLFLATGAAGAVSFVIVWTVDGATRAGYRASQHPVSALALGGRGWVQIANFVVTGAAMAVVALGVRRALGHGAAAVWAPALLAACALGLFASGVFVMDPPVGYPPGQSVAGTTSWHGAAHDVAGLAVFTTLPAAAFVLAGRFWADDGLRWLGVVSLGAGLLTVASFVAYVIVDESGQGGAGVLQRASIVVGWGWIALVAVTLLVVAPESLR